jgi:phage-related minor tail protein
VAGELGSIGVELYAESGRLDAEVSREKSQLESLAATMSRVANGMKAQLAGVSQASSAVKRVQGVEESAKDMEHLQHTTVGARREMLVLAHELVTGNFKRAAGSVMVLGERMDWMSKIMSPAGIAIGVVAAVVGGLAYAFIEAAKQTKEFNNAIQMTGGYAATTEKSFGQMAMTVADDAHVSSDAAREAGLALVKTGQFQVVSMHDTTVAMLNWMRVTGENAESSAKTFARMREDAVKWAEENNKQYHAVTGAQLQQMADLEKLGDKQGAYQILLHAVMVAQGADLEHVTTLWERFVQVVEAAGMAEAAMPPAFVPEVPPAVAENDREMHRLQQIQEVADAKAKDYQQDVFQATQRDLTFQKEFATRKMKRDEEIREKLLDDKLLGKSAADTAKDIALINEKYKDRKTAGTTALDSAQLQAQLKPLQDLISGEDKLYAYQQRTVDKYYQDNKISAQAAYDTTKVILDAKLKIESDAANAEIAILERAKAHSKDAATQVRLQTQIQELQDKKTQEQTSHDEKLSEAHEKATRDNDAYAASLERLAASLGKAEGKGGEYAQAEYDRAHKALLDQAKARGAEGAPAVAMITEGSQLANQQGVLNDAMKDSKVIYAELATTQSKYNLQVQSGQTTEFESWQKIDIARKQAAQELEPIVENMERIAQLSGQAAMIEEAAKARESLEQLKASSDELGKTLNDTFAGAATDALVSVSNHTKTVSQAFIDMCNSIEQTLMQLILKNLMAKLFDIGGGAGGAGPGSAGGLGGFISSLFGGGAGGGGGAATFGADTFTMPTMAAADTSGMSALMGLAGGGPAQASGFYRVNENAPELLSVANRTYLMMGSEPGKVTPLSGGSAMGATSHTWNMNIAVPPGTTRQSSQQQAYEIMREAQIAMMRNA